MATFHKFVVSASVLCAWLVAASPVSADEFYKGKNITIVTSTGAGGVYDLVARLTAKHWGKYLPGTPGFIVNNMPGGGNLLAANYMYEVAPKDGTVVAVFNNAVPLNQVLDGRGVRFDAGKFSWIGSTGGRNEAVFAFRTAGVMTFSELKEKELVLGSTGPGSSISIYPTVMNNLLGTKFKIVNGYKSSTDIFLAMERGEVNSRSGSLASIASGFQSWLDDNRLVFFAQIGSARDKSLPDVPLLSELAASDEDKQVLRLISSPAALGQPYLAPPQISAERLAVLRDSFIRVLRDPEFLADASKAQVDIDPISGDEIAKIVSEIVQSPEPILVTARKAMQDLKR